MCAASILQLATLQAQAESSTKELQLLRAADPAKWSESEQTAMIGRLHRQLLALQVPHPFFFVTSSR